MPHYLMNTMRFAGKKDFRCECCGAYKYNAPNFEWYSLFDDRFLGIVCQKCAVREMFGSNYKNNKRYKRWIKEIK